MFPLTTDWRAGLNVSAPFGLETNWGPGTFPAFSGPFAPLEPSKTKLEMFNINPNIAYSLADNFSIAAGFDYYEVRDAVSDTQAIGVSGDGADTGWNVAALYVLENWGFGLSYRSNVKVQLNGEFDATSLLGFGVDTETQLHFPDMLQIGVSYKAGRQLTLELDVEHTNWSKFKNIVVRSDGSVPSAGIVPGTELVRTENNWRDTYSYHLGLKYALNPDLQIRFGYTYNEDPQPESQFSARYPNSERHLFGGGVKYSINKWDLEAGLLYARWEDRTVDNSAPYNGGDPNGTEAFNGKYELSGIIGGVSVSRYF
jgi:long-chain fatty acid transport protein